MVEQAIETAGLMLGTGKIVGYCLEMICADFLAGANLGRSALGRPADGTQPALPCDDIPCPVPVDSRTDGLCCGISKSYARHDHRPRYPTDGVKL